MNREAENKNLMLAVMAEFKKANLEPLFANLSDEVVWRTSAPQDFFRFGGVHNGVFGIREYTALLFSRYHFTRFEITHIIAQDDIVWGEFDGEAKDMSTDKFVRFEAMIRWTVRDGKIAEHRCFFDTASVLMQIGALKQGSV
jgi:ketosteroid isomerase-like protein